MKKEHQEMLQFIRKNMKYKQFRYVLSIAGAFLIIKQDGWKFWNDLGDDNNRAMRNWRKEVERLYRIYYKIN